ncbi:MAG: PAS domain S-box protein [Magnetococcales bacterium]|nr:PAS domain S-box protein [Magnetococcales bacterium]
MKIAKKEQIANLQQEKADLEKANRELAELKNHFERQVKARTAELEERNRQLRDSEIEAQKYLTFAEAIILRLDITGKIILINHRGCQILGLPEHKIVGKDWFANFIPDSQRDFVRQIHNKIMGGEMEAHEYQESLVLSSNNEERIIYWHNIPELDKQGRIIGILSSGQDITGRKKMETALRDKQALLDTAQEISHIGNWRWQIADNRVEWSDEVYRIFGKPIQSFIPTIEDFKEFVHPDDRNKVGLAIKASLDDPNLEYNVEHRIIRPDGTERTVREIGRGFQDDSGKPSHMIGMVQDITEQKRIAAALLETETSYRSLVENMSSGVAVFQAIDKGEDFIFKSINHAGARLIDVDAKEVLGHRVSGVFPGVKELGLFNVLQRVHKSGSKEYHPMAQHIEERLYRWFENFVYCLPSGEIVLIYEDNTEYRRALEELRKSDFMFRGLLNAFHDPLLLFAKDRTIIWCNESAAELLSTSLKSLVGLSSQEFSNKLCSNPNSCIQPLIEESFTNGKSGVGRTTSTTNNSILDIRTFPIFQQEQGSVSHIILTGTDIGEKTYIQEQAMRSARLATLGVLSASIAHEINNPNNTILFNGPVLEDIWRDIAPILQQSKTDENSVNFGNLSFEQVVEKVPTLLADMTQSSRRIQRIVAQLKFLVRKESNDMSETVDMAAVINDSIGLLHNKIQKMTNNLILDIPNDIPKITGNNQQLEQIVINLLLNALESLPDRSCTVKITLGFKKHNESLVLTIADEGCGMDAKTMESILEPMFTTRADSGGTGLGLAVCKEFIVRHQGAIHFESEVGTGTSAIVELPILK